MIAAPPVIQTTRSGPALHVALSFHDGQIAAWTAQERYVAVIAGTGGGKSVLGAPWLLAQALSYPGDEFLALAPTADMLDRVIVPKLLALAAPLGAQHLAGRNRIVLPSGSILHLVSAEKPTRAEGIHARAVWMDEAGQMDALMWEVARRRVGQKSGRILLTTTPYDMGWLKSQIFDRAMDGDPAYRVITFPSTANPTYPREEFERARREMSADRFAMFYLGEFRRASGLVYPDWAPARMMADEPAAADWKRRAGLDLGWHNATAAVLLAEGPDGQIVVEREHYAAETLLADHAAALKDWGKVKFYADPSAKQSIEELRKYGLDVVAANNDVLAGIDAVTRLIRTDRLQVVKGAALHMLAEFESYVWEQREGEPTDKPRKQDDHVLDSLRYACLVDKPGELAAVDDALSDALLGYDGR